MKNELTKLTKKQMKKIAKMHVKGKKESALETGQRIHNEILKVTGGKVITDRSLLLEGFEFITVSAKERVKSPSGIQTWGRMFRTRWPEEINPKPQPNYFELNEIYGYVSSREYSVFEPVSLAMNLWFYSNYGLEC